MFKGKREGMTKWMNMTEQQKSFIIEFDADVSFDETGKCHEIHKSISLCFAKIKFLVTQITQPRGELKLYIFFVKNKGTLQWKDKCDFKRYCYKFLGLEISWIDTITMSSPVASDCMDYLHRRNSVLANCPGALITISLWEYKRHGENHL